MKDDSYWEERSYWSAVKSILASSSLVSLIFVAIILLIFSIFVFGSNGSHSNAKISDLLNTVGIGILAALVATVVDRSVSARDIESRITKNFREAAGVSTSLTNLGVQTAHSKF